MRVSRVVSTLGKGPRVTKYLDGLAGETCALVGGGMARSLSALRCPVAERTPVTAKNYLQLVLSTLRCRAFTD